ncbi:MAG: hypothetical protein ABW036_00560 [Flavitalea sp.]
MRIFAIFLLAILSQPCLAQLKLKKLDVNDIPKAIHFAGDLVEAVRWTDNTGDNMVILTLADNIPGETKSNNDNRSAALYAYHYLITGESNKQTWKVYDYVEDCPVDMVLSFVDKSFAVTDLNKDGKAEVWIMYKVSCQGDVSPVPMKIIMYQDNKKFAVRGTTKVRFSENETVGGEYVFDEAFKTAPVLFRQYADKLWLAHKNEITQ